VRLSFPTPSSARRRPDHAPPPPRPPSPSPPHTWMTMADMLNPPPGALNGTPSLIVALLTAAALAPQASAVA